MANIRGATAAISEVSTLLWYEIADSRDNALKHETIEQYKVYVKVSFHHTNNATDNQEIERLCSTMIGPDWKVSVLPVRT